MPRPPAWSLSPPRRPVAPLVAALATWLAGVALLLLPPGTESASLWVPLARLFPESARSGLALAIVSSAGAIGYLAADAAAKRQLLRPALTVILALGLLSPAMLAVPLWPALLAAAGLLALPAPVRWQAANDNPRPEDIVPNPFSLAA